MSTHNPKRELFEQLVAPIRHALRGSHVIFVPHDVLHNVPFHALFDGKHYLIETFAISYARLPITTAPVFVIASGKISVFAKATRSG